MTGDMHRRHGQTTEVQDSTGNHGQRRVDVPINSSEREESQYWEVIFSSKQQREQSQLVAPMRGVRSDVREEMAV